MLRIWQFNADRRVGLADRIEQRLDRAAWLIADHPQIGRPGAGENQREFSVTDVQYRITYLIEADRVLIVRVRHTREDSRLT